jgi:hypothetical protein
VANTKKPQKNKKIKTNQGAGFFKTKPSFFQPYLKGGLAVARAALLQTEEGEAVDEADDGVVEALLPPVGAELRVLPHHPTRHHGPVHN